MNPPAPVTRIRGFPVTPNSPVFIFDCETYILTDVYRPGKLTPGFEKGKLFVR